MVNIPRQYNTYDCGALVSAYLEYLSRGAKFNFDETHMKKFREQLRKDALKGEVTNLEEVKDEVEEMETDEEDDLQCLN